VVAVLRGPLHALAPAAALGGVPGAHETTPPLAPAATVGGETGDPGADETAQPATAAETGDPGADETTSPATAAGVCEQLDPPAWYPAKYGMLMAKCVWYVRVTRWEPG
jgi:hypothetical protein